MDTDISDNIELTADKQPETPLAIRQEESKSRRLCSNSSRRRLEQLKFDPIEQMVILARKTDAELVVMRFNPDGSYKERYSAVAYAALLATKQKLINDLMRYGYARVPESVVAERPKAVQGLTINLSQKGDNFLDAKFEMMGDTIDENTDVDSDYNDSTSDVADIGVAGIRINS